MNTDGSLYGNELNPGGLSSQKKHTRRRRVLIVIGFLLLLIVGELLRSNLYIQVEEFEYMNNELPKAFNGVKIVQISDYHNHGGSYDDRLIDNIKEQSPDYIFLTGDIADSIKTDIDAANAFLEKVSKIADCYLVWGNHDFDLSKGDLDKMRSCCKKNKITVLENDYATIERGGSKILIAGTDTSPDSGRAAELFRRLPPNQKFVIWLHHYPEDFEEIIKQSAAKSSQADLVFCGHAHGGLIRLPFVGGIYAPGQGLFPKYTAGRYNSGNSAMIVSRGVGNSGYTLRFLDSFHLVVCTLKSA